MADIVALPEDAVLAEGAGNTGAGAPKKKTGRGRGTAAKKNSPAKKAAGRKAVKKVAKKVAVKKVAKKVAVKKVAKKAARR